MSRWDEEENEPMRPAWWDGVDKNRFIQDTTISLLLICLITSICFVFYNLTCEIQRTNRLMIEKGYQRVAIFNPKSQNYSTTEWQLVDQNVALRKNVWEK